MERLNIFSRILRIGGPLHRVRRFQVRSSLEAASNLLPRRQFESLFASTPDRRLVIRAIAEHLGRSEADILVEIARKIKVGFVARVSAMHPDTLPPCLTIADLRMAGCCGITWNGRLTALACIDPVMVSALLFDTGKLPSDTKIALAPWDVISTALSESEEVWRKHNAACEIAKIERDRTLTSEVLELLVREAEEHGSSVVLISESGDGGTYRFTCADGRKGEGSISSPAFESLRRVLSKSEIVVTNELRRHITVSQGLLSGPQEWCLSFKEVGKITEAVCGGIYPVVTQSAEIESIEDGVENLLALIGDRKNVLLIDDNLTFAGVVGKFLKKHNLDSTHVQNGKEAIELLKRGAYRPDLIVCDVHMPFMNGIDFLGELKNCDEFRDTPVVMLTSEDDVDTEVRVLQHGARAYINKAQDPKVLAAHVLCLIRDSIPRRAA